MSKKIYLLIAVLTALCLFAIGCSAKDTGPAPLRVGMECAYAPWNWTQMDDSKGGVQIANGSEFAGGYDVAVAKHVAKALGRPLEIVKTEWDGLPPGILSGKLDLIIAGMSPTKERRESIDFTDPYYYSDLVVIVLKDGPYKDAKTLSDFAGAKITAQQNTLHYDVIPQMEGVEVLEAMDSFPSMRVALLSGKIDAYISEAPEGLSAQMALPELQMIKLDPGFDLDPEALMVSIGIKKDSPIKAAVNEAIAGLSDADREALMKDALAAQPQNED